MRIVHFAETPLSGAPYRLMVVQRLGGHDARLISHKVAYDGRPNVVFQGDIVMTDWRGKDIRELKAVIIDLVKQADILHFHNYFYEQFVFKIVPEIISYMKGKLIVFQVHSPRSSLKNVEGNLQNRLIGRLFVVAQYQVRQFPTCTPVPNAVPIDDTLHLPIVRNNERPVIAFSPSNTILRDWNNKGYPETVTAIQKIKYPIEYLEITNRPHCQCLQAKQRADIAIDEVMTGSYHLNTLEALSQAQIAICNLDDQCRRVLLDYMQEDQNAFIPIVKANKDTLTETIESLIERPEYMERLKCKSREFMQKYWSIEYINKHFAKAYGVETN